MPIMLGKVRTLLEWTDAYWAKCLTGWVMDTPLTLMTSRAPTVLMNAPLLLIFMIQAIRGHKTRALK